MNGVYDAATSNGKKYVTDHRETITMIANLLEKCYGNSKATLCRESDWNELAHVRMKQGDVGWQHMLAARTELRAWVEGQVSKKELWTPPPSAELEQLEDLDIIDLTGAREDHEVQGGEVEATEEDGGDSDSDDDIPLSSLMKQSKAHQTRHWLKETKPMPGEKEDEYATRCMLIIGRGNADQKKMGGRKESKKMDHTLGTSARKFFEELKGQPSEAKPTCIVDHRDGGDVHGTVYKVKWSNVGYGPPRYEWKTRDWIGKYPSILEDYEKVKCNAFCVMCMHIYLLHLV